MRIPRFDMSAFVSFNNDLTREIDDTTKSAGAVFLAPKSAQITHIGVLVSGAVTGSPTFEVRLETVTASSRTPSGTLVAANANATFTPTGSSWQWIALTTPPTVTAGTLYATVVKATSADGSNKATVVYGRAPEITMLCPYPVINSGAGWVLGTASRPVVTPKYSTGPIHGFLPFVSAGAQPTNYASPKKVGILWYPDIDEMVYGALIAGRINTAAAMTVQLYLSDSTLLASVALSEYAVRSTGTGLIYVEFPDPVEVGPSLEHRLVVASGNVNNITINEILFPDEDSRNAVFGDGQYTYAAGGDVYVETAARVAGITPVIGSRTVSSGSNARARIVNGA